MGESKRNQNLTYGQPVVEPDFSSHVCHCEGNDTCIVCQFESIADEDDLCEFDCTRFAGWLPAGDYFVPCLCNVDVRGLAV